VSSEWEPYLRSLWRKGDRVYRTIAVISSPAVELEDVGDPRVRVTLVIGSPLFQEYERLSPDPKPGKP
jgi:hypothetical protein